MRTLFAIAVALTLPNAWAGPQSYQCQVHEHLSLDGKTGGLTRPPNPYGIGKRFAVDKSTGKAIAGDGVGWGFTDKPGLVLASGNAENSFIVTFESRAAGDGVHFLLLRVNEFQAGKLKPFVMVDGGTVYSGQCE